MTEAEWVEGCSYEQMYALVRNSATTRQGRLCMAACCRLMTNAFFDCRIPFVLDTVEICADDPTAEAIANALWDRFVTSSRPPELPATGPEGQFGRAITEVWQLVREAQDEGDNCEDFSSVRSAIASAVLMALRDSPREVFTGGSGNAISYCARAVDRAFSLHHREVLGGDGRKADVAGTQGRKAIASVFRDIFGNPFRPAPRLGRAYLTWNDDTVRKMAQAIYDTRAFDRLPLLADALEEAGRTDAAILAHCRGAGEHVRGCWVVDALLGKS